MEWNTDSTLPLAAGIERIFTDFVADRIKYLSMKYEELTEKIIKAFYRVYNELGYGFLEKIYENAMYIELTEMGFNVQRQKNTWFTISAILLGITMQTCWLMN
jgi:hypothetical protein